jgi:hypothetical protein
LFPLKFADSYLARIADIIMSVPGKMRGIMVVVGSSYLFYQVMYYFVFGPRLEAECEHRIIEIRTRQVATSKVHAASKPAQGPGVEGCVLHFLPGE